MYILTIVDKPHRLCAWLATTTGKDLFQAQCSALDLVQQRMRTFLRPKDLLCYCIRSCSLLQPSEV